MELKEENSNSKQRDLKKMNAFVHAARNDLNVIYMGIQSIDDLLDQPEKIKEITEVIRNGGLIPLREKLDLILKNTAEGTENDRTV